MLDGSTAAKAIRPLDFITLSKPIAVEDIYRLDEQGRSIYVGKITPGDEYTHHPITGQQRVATNKVIATRNNGESETFLTRNAAIFWLG